MWKSSLLTLLSIFFLTFPEKVSAFSVSETGLREAGAQSYGTSLNLDAGTFFGLFILRPLFAISGLIFLILIIYAGILWMTDRGDLDYVKKAKSILVNSVIGLIILLSAYAITNFVLSTFSNQPIP